MQVQLKAQCTKSANDTCSLIITSIKAVGSDGLVHDNAYVGGIPNELDITSEFFGGSTKLGNMVFLVPAGDLSVVLLVEGFLQPYIYIAIH